MDTYLLYKMIDKRKLDLEESLSFISYIHAAYVDILMSADLSKTNSEKAS